MRKDEIKTKCSVCINRRFSKIFGTSKEIRKSEIKINMVNG